MKRYLILAGVLCLLLSLPPAVGTGLRSLFAHLRISRRATLPEVEQLRLENQQLRQRLALEEESARVGARPARVVSRGAASWNSTFWIDLGRRDGIAKNSPIVYGDALVGVVDEVGARRSRVRLLTDASLNPSVRVLREGQLLAKGELYGSSHPLWRKGGKQLRGTGFNYDFDDDAGPARDLRTGVPASGGPPTALIEEGDLLVTTGMDGIFPPGLRVATVEQVAPLREGGYFFDITARPVQRNLNELTVVGVLDDFGHNHGQGHG